MKQRKLPEDYKELTGDDIMSNFDGEIQNDVAEKIKNEKLFSSYPGWNFHGTVWHEDGSWHCEVWVYGSTHRTISKETLPEIMDSVCADYGRD